MASTIFPNRWYNHASYQKAYHVLVQRHVVVYNPQIRSTIATDKWSSYQPIVNIRYNHEVSDAADQKRSESGLYGAHLVVSLAKRLIRSTFQGRFEPKYLQNYLDEYVFRFNRRKSKSIGKKFMRIVQQVIKSRKINNKDIQWDLDQFRNTSHLG
jgi:hypothetical protein